MGSFGAHVLATNLLVAHRHTSDSLSHWHQAASCIPSQCSLLVSMPPGVWAVS